MAAWYDFYRLWSYALEKDPLSQRSDTDDLPSAGVLDPASIMDIRGNDGFWGGGKSYAKLHDSNDVVDMSSVTGRASRYKEYERLRMVPEIETVMTVFSDEACVAGDTRISTPALGETTIQWLAENKPDERFLVYAWDFAKEDFTLGWAFNPRKTGTRKAIKVTLSDGSNFVCTPDHRVLLRNQTWREAGELKFGSELMAFYRIPANHYLTEMKTNQFPRIYTHRSGWTHERFFIDQWRSGKVSEHQSKVQRAIKAISQGLTIRQTATLLGNEWKTVESHMHKAGFTLKEIKWLSKNPDYQRVIGVQPAGEIDVYDMSVEDHLCFCSNNVVFHNCQKGENGHVCEVECDDTDVKDEVEKLLFSNLEIDHPQFAWNRFKQLCIFGDEFWEKIINPDNPRQGVLKLQPLPADSMYRIETTRGRLVEFQQGKEGPDYTALTKVDVKDCTDEELMQSTVLRFTPDQIVHMRINDDRKTFYPYGQSLIEPARGPAHMLKMMEDAMLVYRLCITSHVKCRTNSGWKYAKDITKDDVVYSYDKLGNCIPARVIWQQSNGIKPVYRVKSAHSDLTGTSTHPVWVRDKEAGNLSYVDLGKLKPGVHQFVNVTHDVEIPKKIDRFYTDKYAWLTKEQKADSRNLNVKSKRALVIETLEHAGLEASKTRIQQVWSFLLVDGCGLPIKLAKAICRKFSIDEKKLIVGNRGERNANRIKLPKFVDEDFASLCGFLIGDGHVSLSDRSSKLLFATGVDESINQRYRKLLKKYFGEVVFRQDKRKADGLGEYCVNNKTACDIFMALGIAGTATTKRIPGWVFNERKLIRKAFILGLVDADGSKRGATQPTWNSTIRMHNRQLIDDIKELWHGIGLCSGVIKERWTDVRYICGKELPAAYSWEVSIADRPLPAYDDVTGIDYEGEQEVFDLEVDNEIHNFIANGIPVHNSRAPERRVFYIDVGGIAPFRAEAFMERMKDMFKKKKAPNRGGFGSNGASAIDERWHATSADEDYWIPTRANSNTRVETLPGAQNLGEIDDSIYFRNKLFVALNFPKNYLSNEDTAATRITLSAQDCKFARLVERLQSSFEYGLKDVAETHLQLLGYPDESYETLKITMTPPSDWRELSRAEVTTNRINNASALKGTQLISDYDILTLWMKYTDEESKDMIGRMKIQKMEELRMQIIAQNPQLLGVGLPGEGEPETGIDGQGPNPMLAPPEAPGTPPPGEMPPAPPGGQQGGPPGLDGPKRMSSGSDAEGGAQPPPGGQTQGKQRNAVGRLPDPDPNDISKYNLDIEDFATEMDFEDIDYSEAR